MRLTTFSDYTIRVLIYLGIHPNEMTTVSALADQYAISQNHLTKVIHYLGKRGYIKTLRGKGGGIRLATQPEAINIGALVRDTEANSKLVECLTPDTNSCKISPICRLAGVLLKAQEAFYRVLDDYTIAYLIEDAAALDALLRASTHRTD